MLERGLELDHPEEVSLWPPSEGLLAPRAQAKCALPTKAMAFFVHNDRLVAQEFELVS